jgi:Sigma-70, region 4
MTTEERLNGRLYDAMRVLRTRTQRIFYLFYWVGWTEAEVARIHNLSKMAVSKILTAAREKLQKNLNAQFTFSPCRLVGTNGGDSRAADSDSGRRPTIAKGESKSRYIVRPVIPSLKPEADYLYGSPGHPAFLKALLDCRSSAYLQTCPNATGHADYVKRTAKSRARVVKAQEREEQIRRFLEARKLDALDSGGRVRDVR